MTPRLKITNRGQVVVWLIGLTALTAITVGLSEVHYQFLKAAYSHTNLVSEYEPW